MRVNKDVRRYRTRNRIAAQHCPGQRYLGDGVGELLAGDGPVSVGVKVVEEGEELVVGEVEAWWWFGFGFGYGFGYGFGFGFGLGKIARDGMDGADGADGAGLFDGVLGQTRTVPSLVHTVSLVQF